MAAVLSCVDAERRRSIDAREHQIQIAVAVEIAERRAARAEFRGEDRVAAVGCDALHAPGLRQAPERGRLAVAGARARGVRLRINVPVDREQLQGSVSVDVKEMHAP
jgi:hypothetical protein